MFGVVIPYFQRMRGLLYRAVRSVIDQTGVSPPFIVIVDDGSPHPAWIELEAFSDAERRTMLVIEQLNAGVSVARNRALDAMPDAVDAIAFLDPDDVWHDDHLLAAQTALDHGCDFYFADHIREGADYSRFVECALNLDDHIRLDSERELYDYQGSLFDVIVRRSPVGTSTVIYRRAIGPKVRFQTGLSANEDTLYWLYLLSNARNIVFCSKIMVSYGTGVGLFVSAKWGTMNRVRYLYDSDKFHTSLPMRFSLSSELREWNNHWLSDIRHEFAINILHLVRKKSDLDWNIIFQFALRHPKILIDFLKILIKKI